jgi:hypothetical protein
MIMGSLIVYNCSFEPGLYENAGSDKSIARNGKINKGRQSGIQ